MSIESLGRTEYQGHTYELRGIDGDNDGRVDPTDHFEIIDETNPSHGSSRPIRSRNQVGDLMGQFGLTRSVPVGTRFEDIREVVSLVGEVRNGLSNTSPSLIQNYRRLIGLTQTTHMPLDEQTSVDLCSRIQALLLNETAFFAENGQIDEMMLGMQMIMQVSKWGPVSPDLNQMQVILSHGFYAAMENGLQGARSALQENDLRTFALGLNQALFYLTRSRIQPMPFRIVSERMEIEIMRECAQLISLAINPLFKRAENLARQGERQAMENLFATVYILARRLHCEALVVPTILRIRNLYRTQHP